MSAAEWFENAAGLASLDALRFVTLEAARFATLDTALNASVIIAVALIAALLLRNASAATRHALWLLVFAVLAITPLLTVSLPKWTAAYSPAALVPPNVLASLAPARDNAEANAWLSVLGAAYLLGFAFYLFRIVRQVRQAQQIARHAWMPGPRVRACAQRANVPERVAVRLSDQVNGPLTLGVRKPIILLPADADSRTPAELTSALLHECAHIERRDVAAQLLISVLRAIYWLNPLVWVAARKQTEAQELACDDRVVSGGVDPHAYAHHLLAVARRDPRRTPGLALPITGGELRHRVKRVMDAGANRGRASIASLAPAALALAVTTGALAGRATPQDSQRATLEASPGAAPEVPQTTPQSSPRAAVEPAPATPFAEWTRMAPDETSRPDAASTPDSAAETRYWLMTRARIPGSRTYTVTRIQGGPLPK